MSSSPPSSTAYSFVLPSGSPTAAAAVSASVLGGHHAHGNSGSISNVRASSSGAGRSPTHRLNNSSNHINSSSQNDDDDDDQNNNNSHNQSSINNNHAGNNNRSDSFHLTESPSTTLPMIRHVDHRPENMLFGSRRASSFQGRIVQSHQMMNSSNNHHHAAVGSGGPSRLRRHGAAAAAYNGASTPPPVQQRIAHSDLTAMMMSPESNGNNHQQGRGGAQTPSPFISRPPEVQELFTRDPHQGVSRMICNNEFSIDEFYALRLLVSHETKTGKVPVHLPHIDLSWMRPLFQQPQPGKAPPSRSEVERTVTECATKSLGNLNLDVFSDDARDFGPDALHPVLLNSPRSALVLLRNGITVTKLLARPPGFYATDKAIGKHSPDRLLLHLRKQRADEVRLHLVDQVLAQYKTLCENVSTAEAILACCPPRPPEPEAALEMQLNKEMEQLEQLRNRTTQAVSRAVREQRELEEKLAAQQKRNEVTEMQCRERINAKLEVLRERDVIRRQRLRRVRDYERVQQADVEQQFRRAINVRDSQVTTFRDERQREQAKQHERVMQRLREAQNNHHNAEVLRHRRMEYKLAAKTNKIAEIREYREAAQEERKMDFAELERVREEAKQRAEDQVLEKRRRAARKVLLAARRADEAEMKQAQAKTMIKSLAELESERRAEVAYRARQMTAEKNLLLEQRLEQTIQHNHERNAARAQILRNHAAAHAIENQEAQEVHDASAQQTAFQKLCGVAALKRRDDAVQATILQRQVQDEAGQWIRGVARHHFEVQRKRIAELGRQ